jgi:antitoxin component YwqK of YwqJK toxin-antitoxin module
VKKNILKHKSFDNQLVLLLLFGCLLLLSPIVAHAQGVQDGKYISHYANGSPKERGFYTRGVKDKTWYYYHENSVIDRKEKWKEGILKWQIFYNKGKIIKTIDEKGVVKTRKGCGC